MTHFLHTLLTNASSKASANSERGEYIPILNESHITEVEDTIVSMAPVNLPEGEYIYWAQFTEGKPTSVGE